MTTPESAPSLTDEREATLFADYVEKQFHHDGRPARCHDCLVICWEDGAVHKHWLTWQATRSPAHVPVARNAAPSVIQSLIDVTRAAYDLMDNSEESGPIGDSTLTVEQTDHKALSDALDVVESLPDDRPGYVMGPAAKASWALRNLFASTPATVVATQEPAVQQGLAALLSHVIDDFREMNPSNYTHDEACDLNNWGVEAIGLAQVVADQLAAAPTIALPVAPPQSLAASAAPVIATKEMINSGMRWLANFQHMRKGDKESALSEAFFAMLAAAPAVAQPAVQAWISVDDRLPDVETPVFIVHSGDVKIGEICWEHPSHEETFQSFMYWDDPNDDGQSWDWQEITHWMPILAAPSQQPAGSPTGEAK